MPIDHAIEPDTFRQEIQDWLEENCPAEMRTAMPTSETVYAGRKGTYPNPASKAWLNAMGERGYTAPEWPKKYGGAGLSKEQSRILREELKRINARPAIFSMAIGMFGPALMEFGNEEQKLRFLPDIVTGKIRWCQGYSEPGAGSDLAGLQARCEDKGDHYLINGQKVWTSGADKSDWIFCLVRTDTSVKHAGISFVVFDMESEGVEVRPIKLISGSSPFCETFLTDVKVPKDQLIGEVNGGWKIAKRLLQYERSGSASTGFGDTGAGVLSAEEYGKINIGTDAQGRLADHDLRNRIADNKMLQKAFHLTVDRITEQAKAGQEVGNTASVLKYVLGKMNQEKTELVVEALGMAGLGWEGAGFTEDALKAQRSMLRAKGNSIEGGTSEINLNIVAKRVLGMPDPKK